MVFAVVFSGFPRYNRHAAPGGVSTPGPGSYTLIQIRRDPTPMAGLELNFLGEFEVRRDGQALPLPPSKKTRALLAFLSMNPKRFRRAYLCDLLWEIPDDPRGSLRWSLSKLRQLVDDSDRARIVADRNFVGIDTDGIRIDALELKTLAGSGLETADTNSLETAVDRMRGNFLEGLDLPNFHEFHGWCIAEREQVAQAQAALLRELVKRLAKEPERAVAYARLLVAVSPYDEELRANLIRLLVALECNDEAEQQFQLGMRLLKEVGIVASGAMLAAKQQVQHARAATSNPSGSGPTPLRRKTDAVVGFASGLIGRNAEAEMLAQLLQQAREGRQARCALVRGEPGMGKTRLIEAVSALARGSGATVLAASAYESESIRPFAMWIDALRRHDSATVGAIFGDHDGANRERLFDRLGDFVATQAAQKPVVLVFDDLHWCDESSAAAIHYIVRANRDQPLLCLLASRESELRDNVAAEQAVSGLRRDGLLSEIGLGPLPEPELVELITARAPSAQAQALSRRCGGNPLLAIELARAEQEGDRSGSITELVRERLNRFGVEGTEILQWAAVLSPHVNVPTIAALTGLESTRIGAVLEAAERQGMLTTSRGGLNFSHELLARAVYTTLSPLRCQVMHRLVASHLEKSTALDLGRAADLAHHAAQSGDPGLAARAMVSAGRLCLRFFANEEALALFRRGMQWVEQLPDAERVCLTIELFEIRLSAGPLEDWESSARDYAALAEQALDHGELAHAQLGYHMAAYVRWAHGQWDYAHEDSLQSERVVRSGKDEDHIVGLAQTAKCLVMIERDLPKADAMLMEADAMARRKGFSHYAIPAGLGMLRFHEGNMDDATEMFKESRTLCKSAGARIDEYLANEHLMMIEFQRGRYQAARDYCAILAELGDKLRVGSEAPFARALTALCDLAIHDYSENLESSLDELRVADAKHRLAYTLTRVAQIDCERGPYADAARRASEALEYATVLERPTEMLLARAILACASRVSGDAAAAARHDRAIADLASTRVARWAAEYASREPHAVGATS